MDRAHPTILRCRRGKRHHHGGDVCGLVVLGVDSTFRTIPTVVILRGKMPSESILVGYQLRLFSSWLASILLDVAVGGDVVQDPAQVIFIISKNPYSTKPTIFERNMPFL